MNRLLLTLVFLTFLYNSNAQKYRTAGGIRIGSDIGLTIKQLISEDKNWTLEAMLTTRNKANESRITLLAEKHFNLVGRGLNFYGGAGLHKGFLNETRAGYLPTYGITGIGGIDISMGRYNFSLDYRPSINLKSGSAQNTFDGYTAISVRYIFVERESKFQSWRKKQKDRFKKRKN